MLPRVYLAGPDVFLPDPAARAAALKRICAQHGLIGVSPLDTLPGEPASPDAGTIARRNEAHIRASDAVLANLTPFRGPSADAGTVYEIGYARGLGLPVFGWTTVGGAYRARVGQGHGTPGRDAEAFEIEDFGLADNLMICCGIEHSGGAIVAPTVTAAWTDTTTFERCVALSASVLSDRKAGP